MIICSYSLFGDYVSVVKVLVISVDSIYNIRNKRGVGHISGISPNKMDATYILYSCKWVLAELVRQNTGVSTSAAQSIVDDIIDRKIEIIWREDSFTRVLDPKMVAKDQILLLLYDSSPRKESELLEITEYKNSSRFRSILESLHSERLIEYQKDQNCFISPLGVLEAEKLIKRK